VGWWLVGILEISFHPCFQQKNPAPFLHHPHHPVDHETLVLELFRQHVAAEAQRHLELPRNNNRIIIELLWPWRIIPMHRLAEVQMLLH
jgi:hypothetical protein